MQSIFIHTNLYLCTASNPVYFDAKNEYNDVWKQMKTLFPGKFIPAGVLSIITWRKCVNIDELYKKLSEKIDSDHLEKNALMSEHTTFRIGGPADLLVRPTNADEAEYVLSEVRKSGQLFIVIGNGSNLLVRDGGFRGVVVEMGSDFARITVDGNVIRAQAGALLSSVSKAAAEAGLTGLEFAGGIPGSVAGGVFMNAGAYGGELKNVVASAVVIEADGKVKTVPVEEMDLSYRHSAFHDSDAVIIEVIFELKKGEKGSILAEMKDLVARRNDKQPVNYPSAGSTFKRPDGYFAGKLIQDAGCMGFSCGGAQVSEKHAGFVINTGGATAKDVLYVIKHVQARVSELFGVMLETEIRIIGEE
jgi:UDP-N-acetylmuramate dehydrogenase